MARLLLLCLGLLSASVLAASEGARGGSVLAERDEGGVEVAPLPREDGEEIDEWRTRQVGAGIRCERMPDNFEVIDAELAAMYMALEETAAQPDAAQRRCLIMSDCL